MSTHYYNAYLEARVDSATPLQLIHLAYESAIAAVCDAREHLTNGRIPERSKAITKAMQILMELSGALDHKAGGEISLHLARLYEYLLDQLRDANFRQKEAPLMEVEKLLRTVGEAWRKLAADEEGAEQAPAVSSAPEQNAWIQPIQERTFYGAAYSY